MTILLQPGPCTRCGARNFQLSPTPGLCPDCNRALDKEQTAKDNDQAKRMYLTQLPFDDKREYPGLIGDAWPRSR